MVEVHPDPATALSDAARRLNIPEFHECEEVRIAVKAFFASGR